LFGLVFNVVFFDPAMGIGRGPRYNAMGVKPPTGMGMGMGAWN
jgi:hypothetical protein